MAALRETILAVDDNQINLKMLYEMLNTEYNYISALDGDTAIEKAKVHHPDLILLDVMMPGKNGYETCKELKTLTETTDIPIIFLTARSDKESIIEGLKSGAVDYISKPFNRTELECRIKNHIQLVKAQKSLKTELIHRNITQKQLTEKTRFLSLVTDNIKDAVFVTSYDGTIVLASAAVKKIFRYEISDLLGKKIWEIAKIDNENKKIKQYFNKIINGENNIDRFIFHDNNHALLIIECHAVIIKYSEKEPNLIVIDINDITILAKSVARFKKNVKLQNNLRIITTNLTHITKIRRCMAYITEATIKITETDELILLFGQPDQKTEYYYINRNIQHCKYGILQPKNKNYNQLIELLKNSNNEIINNLQDNQIPTEISKRNQQFIIYPIKIENQIIGIFYIGNNTTTPINPQTIYSIVTIADLVKNLINKNNFEQRIKSRERELNLLFESSANAIVLVNNNLQIERHNEQFVKMFNLRQGYYSQHNINTLLKGDTLTNITNLINKTSASGKYEVAEFAYTDNKGIQKFYETTCSSVKNGNTTLWILIITNITKLKDIDRAIFSSITATEERERTRMARELHDGIGAILSSINIYINLILTGQMKQPEVLNTLSLTKNLVTDAIQSVKEIANNLHPVILSRFGLVETIKSYIEQTNIIKINFTHNNFDKLDNKNLELTIFRIISELINNTLKYANAKNIYLTLATTPTTIKLQYSDDGVGFDIQQIKNKNKTMGLSNINGRIKALNGTCNFETEPQKGFHTRIEIPYIATKKQIDDNSK